jgi:hypothetical protein
MEKIKLGLYELFSYLLPGLIILFSVAIVYKPVPGGIIEYLKLISSISTGQGLLGLLIAFLLGFSNQHIAFKYFNKMTSLTRLLKVKQETIKLSKYEEKLCKIRHESPANYQTIEKWMAFRGMCYNISSSLIYLFVILIFYFIATNSILWPVNILTLIGIFFFILLFLRRGVSFHNWSISSIESSYSYLTNTE